MAYKYNSKAHFAQVVIYLHIFSWSFYLPRSIGGGWLMVCVEIENEEKLKWPVVHKWKSRRVNPIFYFGFSLRSQIIIIELIGINIVNFSGIRQRIIYRWFISVNGQFSFSFFLHRSVGGWSNSVWTIKQVPIVLLVENVNFPTSFIRLLDFVIEIPSP